MNPRAPRRHPGQSGFVLIGVVIFVLALTIIGLSLYSLSSYEAQFLQRSADGEQAFQSAVGGIERAKFALCSTSRLKSVGEELPRENVTEAVAIQTQPGGLDSTGAVRWIPGETVHLRVTTLVSGQRRTLEADFDPGTAQSYYSQLVTVGGGIEVRRVGEPHATHREDTVLLGGTVWESSTQDTNTWKPYLRYPEFTKIQKSPAVPVPNAGIFIAQNYATAGTALLQDVGGFDTFQLPAGGGGVGYFRAPLPDGEKIVYDPDYSMHCAIEHLFRVDVQGIAVWLFPRGVLFEYSPIIRGTGGDDCLVIVAGQSAGASEGGAGIWFLGGFDAQIPVILVSDGKVLIWHYNNFEGGESDTRAGDMALFAQSLSLMGPTQGQGTVELYRQPDGPLNSYFLDRLVGESALPDVGSGSGHRLTLLTGSWRVTGR